MKYRKGHTMAVILTALLFGSWSTAHGELIGHWKLDEKGQNDRIADASPNELHGVFSAAAAEHSVDGKAGRAIRFPAAGSIRLDQHAPVLGKLTDFTVSMWIQYEGGASRMLFTCSDGTPWHRIQMEINNRALSFGWKGDGSFQKVITKPLAWEPGRWYHVVFVNDSKAGKSILRSNDLVRKTHANTLSPAGLQSPVKSVQIGSLNGGYPFNGCIDDVRLFDSALPLAEQLALYDVPDDPQWVAAKTTLLENQRRLETARQARELFYTEEAPHLSKSELQQKVEWLFQLDDDDLLTRADKEIGWTRRMIDRMQNRAGAPDLADELAALRSIEQRASPEEAVLDASKTRRLYFDIRALKRSVMLKSPEMDFAKIICVDTPYTQGREWLHESRYRSEMCASHGAKLLVLEDFAETPVARRLAPPDDFGQPAAMLRFDLSFDACRAVFCMKPEREKVYHLYEIGLDGKDFRQITFGGYSDIEPIYLPDGGYLFLSTRAEVYAQCGMWARQAVLARCDADGRNVYILSPGTEPEYTPSMLEDGRVLYTRWEYIDKFNHRPQKLWTMRPDGTAATMFWGNQSAYPDHVGEARQVPGTSKVLFSGFGHHNVYAGCVGIVDPSQGLNYPKGIWKVTQEIPWPESGDDRSRPTPGATEQYHTSGKYDAYKMPYPLSEELFLVSARTGPMTSNPQVGHFKLYLMDIYGNRELLYQGDNNVFYAQPVRRRTIPLRLPALADFPGPEKHRPTVRPGVFFSTNIFAGAPAEIREHGRYLRVVESLPKNYSVGIVHSGGKPFGSEGPNTAFGAWGEVALRGKVPTPTTDIVWGDGTMYCGPATTLTGTAAAKQERGTLAIGKGGAVYFEVPPCRQLYFQVLDKHYRAVHTMRSWVSVRPGEHRGCVGCHELHNSTSANQPFLAGREPDAIQPPPWGVRSLSYVRDIQPIFDRACAECHSGNAAAVEKLDLTLRPEKRDQLRWGGIFPEPYITLLMGEVKDRQDGLLHPRFDGRSGFLAVPTTWDLGYGTLSPLSCLSPKARLIDLAMDKTRCGKHLAPEDLRMLISWIDLWAMYRSDEELREIEDPPAEWFPLWSYPPKTKTAPRVRTEYSQDEYTCPQDRL